jgi:hypothetical protein
VFLGSGLVIADPTDIGRVVLAVGKVCGTVEVLVSPLWFVPKKKLLNEVAMDDARDGIG